MTKQITIGIACDGVAITVNDKRYWISQEDGECLELGELFRDLGYEIEWEQEY